ncbi:TIGR03756 family integrating conjugative element protein [Legionella feeleii]|uniref:Integrating conjugative element protein, PFL_4710 family n=1 Tax=Legionella feeleii TaxID=453 RepID=A0A0W0TH28_9GAMM|nr:TIGR03756 family integrating conjugative element protein [Legionella feeleii]KTC94870.1 TraU protein [Legionella feeleii]SPX62046.1 integrating conjugative element protein, PFL_4710 family [Legionella feeleii]
MIKWLLYSGLLFCSMTALGVESTRPTTPASTPQIAARVFKKGMENSHFRIIGSCLWLEGHFPPKVTPGPAVSQFIPDLIVTVSNHPGENPWAEANGLYENKAALAAWQSAFKAALNLPLGFGDGSGQLASQRLNEDRTRVVSVIGSPSAVYPLKGVTHRPETTFMKLYYSSLADAVNERTELGELAYMATHPQLLINHEIGSASYFWGHELPRLMRITQPSRFRASVVAAMHAADIVTNEGMHLKVPTTNACGPHCVVANVVFDPKQKQVIWQEVYPKNRNIIPGDSADEGIDDEAKGNGNYIFVVWRKYKGCVTQPGKLLWGMPPVGSPQKR